MDSSAHARCAERGEASSRSSELPLQVIDPLTEFVASLLDLLPVRRSQAPESESRLVMGSAFGLPRCRLSPAKVCGAEQIPRAAEVCCDRTARGQYLQGHTTSGEVEVDARRRLEDLPRVVRIDAAGATVVDDEGQPVRTQPDVAALAALA